MICIIHRVGQPAKAPARKLWKRPVDMVLSFEGIYRWGVWGLGFRFRGLGV